MSNLIKKHWFIVPLALIFGLAIVFPTVFSVMEAGRSFRGIYPTMNDDEQYYLGTTREVYKGHYNSGNPFIKELKNKPSLTQSLSEIILSGEAKLFGFSVPKTFAINDFILPFLGVILLYALFFNITKSRTISAVSSSVFFLVFLNTFGRPISPQFNFIFFIYGLLLLWKIFSKDYDFKTSATLNVSLAVIFGCLVYIYPFYWSTIIVLYVVNSLILAVWQKNFRYWIKNWMIFGVVSVLIALPYALNLLKSVADPSFAEASLRNGFIFTHRPGAFVNVALLGFCLPVLFLIRKDFIEKRKLFFGYSLILSGIILNWQNIITGKGLQFSSHYYMVTILFVFLVIAICAESLSEYFVKYKKFDFKKASVIFLMAVLLFFIFYRQKREIFTFANFVHPSEISDIQNSMIIADWLNKNTAQDSVVYALGQNYDLLLPVYTHNSSYWQTYAGMYLMSDDELENRWVIQNFFEDIKRDDVYGNRGIWINKFIDTYQSKESRRKILQFITGKKYPETVLMEQKYVDVVLDKYAKFKKEGFEKALKTYKADYVLVDFGDEKYKNLENKFKQYTFLNLSATLGSVSIFKVK